MDSSTNKEDKEITEEQQVVWDKLKEPYTQAQSITAFTTQPHNPITGDLWLDTLSSRLHVYDGSSWKRM